MRFFASGSVDTSFGTSGIAAWGPDQDVNGQLAHYVREEAVAVGVRHDGAVDIAVAAVGSDAGLWEDPWDWFVQRVTAAGTLGVSSRGPADYIDPTEECLQEFPLALAEQTDGKTLVSGVAYPDASDYTTYYLLERYDRALQPDVGVALDVRVKGTPELHGNAVTVHVALNGPCRLIVRLQTFDGRNPIGAWLSPTRIDVAHEPTLVRLPLRRGELLRRRRYAVVISAYDARGHFTQAVAPLAVRP